MNSKGKPLTPIDLIRNYILMSLPSDEQMKLYEGYWRPIEQLFGHEADNEFNAFIWYWLWLKVPNRKPREDEAYDEFKTYCQDEGLEGDPEGLLKELREYARRYANMFLGKEKDKALAAQFQRIASPDVKPIRPLMLALYALYEKEPALRDNTRPVELSCTVCSGAEQQKRRIFRRINTLGMSFPKYEVTKVLQRRVPVRADGLRRQRQGHHKNTWTKQSRSELVTS